MGRLERLLHELDVSRKYTIGLLEQCDPADWFRQPSEGVTHLAWQVGHLAIAEYRLALCRLRGEQPGDKEFIPTEYLTLFGKGSTPVPEPRVYPSVESLRSVFDAVHERTLGDLASFDAAQLDDPSQPEHPMFTTKGGALHWCAQHEMVHAGQIGLLRRLLGQECLW